MADWIQTPTKWINLSRASLISVVPSDQEIGRWVVLAQVGTQRHFLAVFDTPAEARDWVADQLEGEGD